MEKNALSCSKQWLTCAHRLCSWTTVGSSKKTAWVSKPGKLTSNRSTFIYVTGVTMLVKCSQAGLLTVKHCPDKCQEWICPTQNDPLFLELPRAHKGTLSYECIGKLQRKGPFALSGHMPSKEAFSKGTELYISSQWRINRDAAEMKGNFWQKRASAFANYFWFELRVKTEDSLSGSVRLSMCLLWSLVVKGGPGAAGSSPETYRVTMTGAGVPWASGSTIIFTLVSCLSLAKNPGRNWTNTFWEFAEVFVRCVGSTEVRLHQTESSAICWLYKVLFLGNLLFFSISLKASHIPGNHLTNLPISQHLPKSMLNKILKVNYPIIFSPHM